MRSLKWALASLSTLALVNACGFAPTGTRLNGDDPRDPSPRYGLLTAEQECPTQGCNAARGFLAWGLGNLFFNVAESTTGDLSFVELNIEVNEFLVTYLGNNMVVTFEPDSNTGEMTVHFSGTVTEVPGGANDTRAIDVTVNLVTGDFTAEISGEGSFTAEAETLFFVPGQCTLFVPD